MVLVGKNIASAIIHQQIDAVEGNIASVNVNGEAYGLSVGDEITVPGDEITNAVKRYWKHGLFSKVHLPADRSDYERRKELDYGSESALRAAATHQECD